MVIFNPTLMFIRGDRLQLFSLEKKRSALIREHNGLGNYAIRLKVSAFQNNALCTKCVTESVAQRCSRSATLLKNDTLTQVFSYEFCEINKNTFLIEHFWWLLLVLFSNKFSG